MLILNNRDGSLSRVRASAEAGPGVGQPLGRAEAHLSYDPDSKALIMSGGKRLKESCRITSGAYVRDCISTAIPR